ncbi:NAD synthetase [Brevipalpus obovatus]|uniref:NAD synthetase n=1 Tax=Brevipalpus obovatus TaxID=246614 RepID=UPI003D9E009C
MNDKLGLAVFTINQFALDFHGNCERIIESIKIALEKGSGFRIGPELEICGYSCEDSFYEEDTVHHSWESVAKIIEQDFRDIIIDLGMPIYKDGGLYNCRVILLNNKILAIRPKVKLANNGNYRESRHFLPWNRSPAVHNYCLPSFITSLTGQTYVPFGSEIIIEIVPPKTQHTLANIEPLRIGFEMCEELWVHDSSHARLYGQQGVHIIVNSSASYWEIRKLQRVQTLMEAATLRSGGLYAFSNLIGCDGQRLCFYGRSLIVLNGKVLTKTTSRETMFKEIEGIFYSFDPLDVINFRQQNNAKIQSQSENIANYHIDCSKLSSIDDCFEPVDGRLIISLHNFRGLKASKASFISPEKPLSSEEEIMYYASLWLWDYLRRNQAWCQGFILPLSGGLDSASVACLVYCMCSIAWKSISDNEIIRCLSKILGTEKLRKITGSRDLCKQLLQCWYLKTKFSGSDSEHRAKDLAQLCGAEFYSIGFTSIYEATDDLIDKAFRRGPDNKISLRHQNLQARLRMVLTYHASENRLVLASSNVDEALVGYLTKYDCSSADINPIGSLSKQDLRSFLVFVKENVFIKKNSEIIQAILNAAPSAELTGENQKDEDDLGLTYEELSLFGQYRRGKYGCCGPFSMFKKIMNDKEYDPAVLAQKVKRFFTLHARNRHKQTVLTPSLHAETYSPDDNRFDHRQFLFDTEFKRQFESIDQYVRTLMVSTKT